MFSTLSNSTPEMNWNIVDDVRQMLAYPFMVNAFRAGTIIAIMAGIMGWFMVLRRQTFAGHTLAVVGFPGAAGAILLGVTATYGLFTFAVAAAVLIAFLPHGADRSRSEESAVTGTVMAFALACGFLFANLYGGFLEGVNSLLFGSFLSITNGQVVTLFLFAVLALIILSVIGRSLLFASIDPVVAAARGVPVRGLSVAFLILLGVAAAEVSQITGTLLVFALLVVPAASGQVLTARPSASLLITVVIALCVTWVAIFVAYFSRYPIGFYITSLAFIVYLFANASRRLHTSGLKRTRTVVAQ
jgi:zinc/manganese transport system permease protein